MIEAQAKSNPAIESQDMAAIKKKAFEEVKTQYRVEITALKAGLDELEAQLGCGLGGKGDAEHIKKLQASVYNLLQERNNLQEEVRKLRDTNMVSKERTVR